MIYGTKRYKNGKRAGRLEFNTGKTIFLKDRECEELDIRIAMWKGEFFEKEYRRIKQCEV